MAAAVILPMDQPKAFLKLIEAQHPVISMLASQGASAGVGNGVEGSTKEEEDLGHQQPFIYRNASNDKDAIIFRDSGNSCDVMNWNDTTMGKDTGFRVDASKSRSDSNRRELATV